MSAQKFDEILKNLAHDIAASNSVVKNLSMVLLKEEPGHEIFDAIFKASEKTQSHIRTLQDYLSAKTRAKPTLQEVSAFDVIGMVRNRLKDVDVKCGSGFFCRIAASDFSRTLDIVATLLEQARFSEMTARLSENSGSLELKISASVAAPMFFENTFDVLLCETLFQSMNGVFECTVDGKKIHLFLSLPIYQG